MPPTPRCPANSAGGPNSLTFTTQASGTDLDLGWTGMSHGFSFVPGASFGVCLSGCDATCVANGSVGPETRNGALFGPPLPLLAANVPLCVVNRFVGPITGTADFATGDVTLQMGLRAVVFFTEATELCPRCTNGRCTSGENVAEPCTVDATTVIAHGIGNRTYDLSRECLPIGNPVGSLDLVFDPITSGTSAELVGPTPCPRAGGLAPRPNACHQGCGAPCEGPACAEMAPDPVDPDTMSCRDEKGGVSQLCCYDDPTQPCFPLDGEGVLRRTGRPEAPETSVGPSPCHRVVLGWSIPMPWPST